MICEFTHVMLKVCVKLAVFSAERPDPWENLRTWWDSNSRPCLLHGQVLGSGFKKISWISYFPGVSRSSGHSVNVKITNYNNIIKNNDVSCYTWNQSMVQQLMSDGNIRSRLRNASPIGLIANTMWRLALTRSMKKLYMASGVASIFLPWCQWWVMYERKLKK